MEESPNGNDSKSHVLIQNADAYAEHHPLMEWMHFHVSELVYSFWIADGGSARVYSSFLLQLLVGQGCPWWEHRPMVFVWYFVSECHLPISGNCQDYWTGVPIKTRSRQFGRTLWCSDDPPSQKLVWKDGSKELKIPDQRGKGTCTGSFVFAASDSASVKNS